MRTLPFLLGLSISTACAPPAPCPCACPPAPKAPGALATGKPICTPPTGNERQELFDGAPMLLVCKDVFVQPALTADERESVMRWYSDGLAELGRLFGMHEEAMIPVIVCKTSDCATKFSGASRRSRVVSRPRRAMIIAGLGSLAKQTFVHEMIHVAIEQRTAGKPQVPAWFNEGVATYLSDNVPCDGVAPVIDDLRRLSRSSAWNGFTEQPSKIDGAYCQAKGEIGAWAAKHGDGGILTLIDAVAAGASFDELYGPMLTPGAPPLATGRELVAKFGFDETSGSAAIDRSSHPHAASLFPDATRAAGHSGQAVTMRDGGHVRADGFEEYALPDAPFTLSLWVKPAVDAKVLVHTSLPIEGGGGWCSPLLGFDERGRLVAETLFAPDPKAFLIATGPSLALGEWTHVAATWSAADGLRLYTNGKLAADAPPKSAAERHRDAPAAPMHLFFGSDHGSMCWTGAIERGDFAGALDEVHVFSYALSPAEVASDMKAR